MRRLINITVIVLILSVSVRAQEVPPDIPPDSLGVVLHQSYLSKLDSAVTYTSHNDYRRAVAMYVSAFEELKRFNEQRREHAANYLANLYETEQKEERIRFLDEELPLKEKLNFLLIILCAIFVVMLIALFVFLKYRLNNILQNATQKENETRLMELESEERLLQNRLHAMEVEKYQKELLAESLLVNHKKKVLEDLRLFLVQNPKLNRYKSELEKILGSEPAFPAETDFQSGVDEIHPAFYARLQQQASNKLTPLDLEYCRMIFMKMASKEMADILGVEPKTVRIGKYRLKRKFELDKEDDLVVFIEKMGTVD